MPKKKSNIHEYEYKAEMKQLLHLIVHSLYTHPEVFLRELISNASDSLNKVRFRMLTDNAVVDPDEELNIILTLDSKKHTFSIEDTGIGMTEQDLNEEIGTVASSGTMEYLEKLKAEGKTLEGDLIGQFGVGFYSVFMVTDEVTIETRHADADSKAYCWKSTGQGTYTIEEIKREKRGTKISFKLKKEYHDFAEEWRVKNIVDKYSTFVEFPIFIGKERLSRVGAIWQKPKDQVTEEQRNEFYKYIANDTNPPLGHLHLSMEGKVNFKAMIFFPSKAPLHFLRERDEKTLNLYADKIFIQDDAKELLPEYLRFVKGVVDTEDLPLNVSREVTQSSPAMQKINQVIVSKILGLLRDWAKKDRGKYDRFYKEFGQYLKIGLNMDFTNREKLIELFRFETTKSEADQFISLKEYVDRMDSEQKFIYYLAGEDRSSVLKNPNLEYFKKNDIEVLLLSDPYDVMTVPAIHEYDKKALQSIEKADLDIAGSEDEGVEALNEDLSKPLIEVFKETLGDKVEDVIESKRLVNSACTLVTGKDAMDAQMERMMKMMDEKYASQKKILEINTKHPLIKNLARVNLGDSKDPVLRSSILQLFDGALLIHGNLDTPADFVERMTELMTKATD
ncbi:MAG: molecular chaperone HtpG [Candidatus Marinimicrobia bacterium]|nr:molecular chaperone HtpG [Candidatus Neomarinimicrobiota bacterium]